MRPSPPKILLVLAAVAAISAACGTGGRSERAGVAAAAADPSAATRGDAEPLSLGTPALYRGELLRAAMRGLRFDSGRAVVVPEEAEELAAGPDAASSEAAAAEGRAHLARNERIEAIGAHTRAVLFAPGDARRYLELGGALQMQRRGEEALAAFRTGIDLDPDSAALRRAAAEPLIWLGRRAEAVQELREAERLDPESGEVQALLAIQLYYLEDPASAWDAARRAEALGHELPPQFRALLERRHPEAH